MNAPRILAIMGSGETAPTMIKVHRALFGRLGPGPVAAVLLDTPFGFQSNADELTERTRAYFRDSVDREMSAASFRRGAGFDALGLERLRLALRQADLVFAGPGSPTYALRQWEGSPVPTELAAKLRVGGPGGCVTFSSAAALTLGVATVPVYEIYKVGDDPHWLAGLDLTAALGLSVAVIPHYDNAEGGTHDTRFCYLGEERLRLMESDLPPQTFVLGVDEHTAAVFDLDSATVSVLGRGGLTVRAAARSHVIAAGAVIPVGRLAELSDELRHQRASTGTPAPALASAPEPAPVPAPGSPLLQAVTRLEAEFAAAMAGGDATGAVSCALALEAEIHAWSADTLQSDEAERGRAALRGMVVRLGEAAASGLRSPREVAAPWVDALVALRASARADRRWADADEVRAHLTDLGVVVSDEPGGTTWELA